MVHLLLFHNALLYCTVLCAPCAPALRPVACGPSPSRALPVGGRANELLLLILGDLPRGALTTGRTEEAPRITAMPPTQPRVDRADARGYQGYERKKTHTRVVNAESGIGYYTAK